MARIMASIFILCTLCFYVSGQVPKGRIIFSSTIANDKNPTAQLFEINSDGTGEHRITFTNKENDLPGYFHNRIVYRQKSGSTSIASILITGIDSGVVKPLIKDKLVCNPKWRGDGKLIAYEYYTNKQQQIWVMDSNGHNKKMLITNARHPNWSNDNTKIVFTRNYEVYLMNIKTGIQKKMTNLTPQGIQTKWPTIATDENKIAFVVYYGNDPRRSGVCIIDLKKKSRKIIENCSMPCWTNDPKYIICSYHEGSKSQQIAMINIETEEKIFITNNNRDNDFPVWVSGRE